MAMVQGWGCSKDQCVCRACPPLISTQVILMSFSGVFSLASGGLLWYIICLQFPFTGFQFSERVCPLRWNQDPAPRLYHCFLADPPLSLQVFPSLISNCLNLLFGIQGRSWRPKKKCPHAQEGQLEWVNLTQMTIISTTVGRNPFEEMEQPSWSTKESEMQYLDAI